MPVFKLTLHKTYYDQGFFNVTVEFDRFVRAAEGPIDLILGSSDLKIEASINRRANLNGTARIIGGLQLRDWFQENYKLKDVVEIDLGAVESIRIGRFQIAGPAVHDQGNKDPIHKAGSVMQQVVRKVTADELAHWRRRLIRIVNSVDDSHEKQEGLVAKINRLSRTGKIPRETAALMRVVAEMRNAAEYEGKQPSKSESDAIKNAWMAVVEWANAKNIVDGFDY